MSQMNKFALTFDIDFVSDPFSRDFFDEIELLAPTLIHSLKDLGDIRSTWFVSIDRRVESSTGTADFAFKYHKNFIETTKESNVVLGWHFHPYHQSLDGSWVSPTSRKGAFKDFRKYAELARGLGLSHSRIGWGAFSNEILTDLIDVGFTIDSTCIARPRYPWIPRITDWSSRNNDCYYPSQTNYLDQDDLQTSLREVPISTFEFTKPTDTIKSVKRYFNISDKHSQFKKMVEDSGLSKIVSVSHPYEFFSSLDSSEKSFKIENLLLNLKLLKDLNFEFVGLEQI
jgi:hypothetical protein